MNVLRGLAVNTRQDGVITRENLLPQSGRTKSVLLVKAKDVSGGIVLELCCDTQGLRYRLGGPDASRCACGDGG